MSRHPRSIWKRLIHSNLAILTAFCVVVSISGTALFVRLQPSAVESEQSASSQADQLAGEESQSADMVPKFIGWVDVEDFPTGIARFETVFWEPDDTRSLRTLIRETDLVHGKRVLEIGTGTGLVALCCLANGADHVVATDINPHAIANADYNARRFPITESLETRLVAEDDPGAFAVIRDEERFDLILSNPPWEDGKPAIVDEFALYDPEFALLESLLAGLEDHLAPGGRVLLAYGCVEAIRVLQRRAPARGWQVTLRDDRDLNDLPNLFLPGMLLELERLAKDVPVSGTLEDAANHREINHHD